MLLVYFFDFLLIDVFDIFSIFHQGVAFVAQPFEPRPLQCY
jgi:hypothetical protein